MKQFFYFFIYRVFLLTWFIKIKKHTPQVSNSLNFILNYIITRIENHIYIYIYMITLQKLFLCSKIDNFKIVFFWYQKFNIECTVFIFHLCIWIINICSITMYISPVFIMINTQIKHLGLHNLFSCVYLWVCMYIYLRK